MTLGGRISSARDAAGYSTAQLARRVGVMHDTMANWEADRDEPRANKLVTLAGVLGVSVMWLSIGETAELEQQTTYDFEETRTLKIKLESLLSLHEQTSKMIFEIQSDIQRLQARIDGGEIGLDEGAFEDA